MSAPPWLTDKYYEALHEYAKKAGRTWKNDLAHDWARAGSHLVDQDTYCYLHIIRNNLGPTWLDTFELEEE